jgi:phage-related holin
MFLLSLWDGTTYKADLQDLLYNDQKVFTAMLTIMQTFYINNEQLDSYITKKQMGPIITAWGKQFQINSETK